MRLPSQSDTVPDKATHSDTMRTEVSLKKCGNKRKSNNLLDSLQSRYPLLGDGVMLEFYITLSPLTSN